MRRRAAKHGARAGPRLVPQPEPEADGVPRGEDARAPQDAARDALALREDLEEPRPEPEDEEGEREEEQLEREEEPHAEEEGRHDGEGEPPLRDDDAQRREEDEDDGLQPRVCDDLQHAPTQEEDAQEGHEVEGEEPREGEGVAAHRARAGGARLKKPVARGLRRDGARGVRVRGSRGRFPCGTGLAAGRCRAALGERKRDAAHEALAAVDVAQRRVGRPHDAAEPFRREVRVRHRGPLLPLPGHAA